MAKFTYYSKPYLSIFSIFWLTIEIQSQTLLRNFGRFIPKIKYFFGRKIVYLRPQILTRKNSLNHILITLILIYYENFSGYRKAFCKSCCGRY